jgi:hypothetical protein
MIEAIGPATWECLGHSGVLGLTGHRPAPFNRKPRLSGASPRSG